MYIRPRKTREGNSWVRKSTLKTWNSDLFCNSAMELILLILKMASGYLLASFLHERCTANWSHRYSHGDVHAQMLLPSFAQLLRLYLPMHACAYISMYPHLRADSHTKVLGQDVVQRLVNANPGSNFNLGLFFFSSKAFSLQIFAILFRVANRQIVDKKN